MKYFKELNSTKKIINCYDSSNIFVLPSYTEGAPKVILESLIRYRPVIVFEDIKHVKKDFNGIFVCKRNSKSFIKKINCILKIMVKFLMKLKKIKFLLKNIFTIS